MDCEGIEDQVILSLGDPLRRQTDTASILTNQCSETEASVFNSRYSSLTTRLLLLILAWPYSSTVDGSRYPAQCQEMIRWNLTASMILKILILLMTVHFRSMRES